MKKLTGGVLLALVVAGCSSTPASPKHGFDHDDIGLLKTSFAEVVRKNCGRRDDGERSDPTSTGMRFVFNLHKPVDGAHSELVDSVLGKVPTRVPRSGQAPGGIVKAIGDDDVFQVIVHRARSATDPVLEEESARLAAEITAMMESQERALLPLALEGRPRGAPRVARAKSEALLWAEPGAERPRGRSLRGNWGVCFLFALRLEDRCLPRRQRLRASRAGWGRFPCTVGREGVHCEVSDLCLLRSWSSLCQAATAVVSRLPSWRRC